MENFIQDLEKQYLKDAVDAPTFEYKIVDGRQGDNIINIKNTRKVEDDRYVGGVAELHSIWALKVKNNFPSYGGKLECFRRFRGAWVFKHEIGAYDFDLGDFDVFINVGGSTHEIGDYVIDYRFEGNPIFSEESTYTYTKMIEKMSNELAVMMTIPKGPFKKRDD